MPVGVTLYWNPDKVSHITGHSFNYFILNSKVLFGEDTLDSVSAIFICPQRCADMMSKKGGKEMQYSFWYYSWRYEFAMAGAAYNFNHAF